MEVQKERQKENNKTPIIVAIINGCIALITTLLTLFYGHQLDKFQSQTQEINVSIINTLGEQATNQMKISETSNIGQVTDELMQAYLAEVDKTKELETSQKAWEFERESLQDQIDILEQHNKTLYANIEDLTIQTKNLKDFILEKYSSTDVDRLITMGFVKEVAPTRLDALEDLDGEYYEQVASVKDLYGTTHSVSYKMHARNKGGVAWIKFKLDGKYDIFTANVVTSEETDRGAGMSVELYIDGNIVGRLDDIVRDEQVRTISASVNGGNVLLIKVIGTAATYRNICFISDGQLTRLE